MGRVVVWLHSLIAVSVGQAPAVRRGFLYKGGKFGSFDVPNASRVRIVGLGILILLGLIDAVYGRHTMQSDGISYLDMGDAILRADWPMAINAHWSPLYPFLLGLALKLVRPSSYHQFSVVHFVNFLIYLFALASFHLLLRTLVGLNRTQSPANDSLVRLPDWALFALGYTIFAWSSLALITLEMVTPDMLMAAFLYLAMSMLLQIREKPEKEWRYVALGVVLGLGYLAKAPMFLIAFIFLALSWILAGMSRRAALRVLSAALLFLLIAGPYVIALSKMKGRFTFSDSARINYIRIIDGVSPLWYFQNLGEAGGHFKHNPRKIFDSPTVYEFADPIRGTIPVWNDPSYWSEGVVPRLDVKEEMAQKTVISRNLGQYLEMVFSHVDTKPDSCNQAALFVGFVVLCSLAGRGFLWLQTKSRWPIWFVALAGLGMYAMILVLPRYVAAFFALLWLALFSGITIPATAAYRRVVSIVTSAVVLAISVPLAHSAVYHLGQAAKRPYYTQWHVAQDLRRLGVAPGSRVGRIGGDFSNAWARLLGVSIVAEVPRYDARGFWSATPDRQQQVIEHFRQLGVSAIIAEQIPAMQPALPDEVYAHGPGWVPLADGSFYALKISP